MDYFTSCNNALRPAPVYPRLAAAHAQPMSAPIEVNRHPPRAPEGGVDLEPYPALRAWLTRMEALPGFLPVQRGVVA